MPAFQIRHRPPVDTTWHTDAACHSETDVFFGPHGERQAEQEYREATAKLICHGCPVREECREYALNRPEQYGVWGGMSEDERAKERRRRRRRASQAA